MPGPHAGFPAAVGTERRGVALAGGSHHSCCLTAGPVWICGKAEARGLPVGAPDQPQHRGGRRARRDAGEAFPGRTEPSSVNTRGKAKTLMCHT